MRKLFTMMMLGAAVFAFTGCGEKTTEEKIDDAATEMKKDADGAATDLEKAAEAAKEDASKALDKLTN